MKLRLTRSQRAKFSGLRSASKDPRLHVYSVNCAWHGPIEKAGSLKLPASTALVGGREIPIGGENSPGLPCCPHCKSVLYQIEEDKWQAGIPMHEAKGHSNYGVCMEWIAKQPRCWPTLRDAGKAFTGATGLVVIWDAPDAQPLDGGAKA